MNRAPSPPPRTGQNLSLAQVLAQARAYWQAGQAGEAAALCQRILTVFPGQADALHLLGLMAYAQGHLEMAITHLRAACEALSIPAVYVSDLAEMCRQRGFLAEAEAAGRRAVALDASLPGAWNNLGIILQESGKFEESLGCLEHVLTLQPDNAGAHNNLGNSCKRLGLLGQAEAHWRRALALKPDYPEPCSNLVNLLTDQGQFDTALAYGQRAIALNPRLADAYINLAATETARQNYRDALAWLDRLLAFAPAHGTGLAARALALKQLDRLDEALAAAQRAIASAPDNAEAHNASGLILQALGRFMEALAAYDRAAALPGTAAEQALVNRGILFMEHGQAAQAEAAYDLATARFPRSASAWFNRADLVRFRADDPAIGAMQALLTANVTQSQNNQMLLHFALGKAFLDSGDAGRAFAYLDTGNKMKRALISYDADATSRWLGMIAAQFTPALFERLAGAGTGAVRPVFVLGMPRSGTTLVEQILASHPDIFGAGELSHMQALVHQLAGFPASVSSLTPERAVELGQAYLAAIAPLGQGQRHVVDKMPSNFLYAGLIRLILPAAKIIHCRRDPVDTCLSCYSKLFTREQNFSYDQTELGRFHRDYQKLTAHWRAVLPASHFLEVDYEAVVDDLEGQARRMLAFLGLPWNPACLAFHRTERPVRTASVNQVRQPVYRSSTGRWRQHAQYLQQLLISLTPPANIMDQPRTPI